MRRKEKEEKEKEKERKRKRTIIKRELKKKKKEKEMKPDEASEHDSYGRIHVFLFDVISQMDFRMRLMERIEE